MPLWSNTSDSIAFSAASPTKRKVVRIQLTGTDDCLWNSDNLWMNLSTCSRFQSKYDLAQKAAQQSQGAQQPCRGSDEAGGAESAEKTASLLSRTGAVADSGESSIKAAIAVSATGARVKVSSISKMIDEEKARFARVSPASIAAASGEHGFDKLKFWAAIKDQLPIHYKLFRIVDTALPSEANCERHFPVFEINHVKARTIDRSDDLCQSRKAAARLPVDLRSGQVQQGNSSTPPHPLGRLYRG